MLIGIHTRPQRTDMVTYLEIMRLKAVYDVIKKASGITDAIILGDLNAAGSYVRLDHDELRELLQFLKFHDTIGPVDSTTRRKDNAYDKCAKYLT